MCSFISVPWIKLLFNKYLLNYSILIWFIIERQIYARNSYFSCTFTMYVVNIYTLKNYIVYDDSNWNIMSQWNIILFPLNLVIFLSSQYNYCFQCLNDSKTKFPSVSPEKLVNLLSFASHIKYLWKNSAQIEQISDIYLMWPLPFYDI